MKWGKGREGERGRWRGWERKGEGEAERIVQQGPLGQMFSDAVSMCISLSAWTARDQENVDVGR